MECRRQKPSSRVKSLGSVGADDSVAIHRIVPERSKEDTPFVFQQARVSLKRELAIAHIKRKTTDYSHLGSWFHYEFCLNVKKEVIIK